MLARFAPRFTAPMRTYRAAAAHVQRRFNQQQSMESHKFDPMDAHRRRLVYRSKQRGWLELDIMLGEWSSQNLHDMGEEELKEFEEILNLENPDLFKWLTLQEPIPQDLDGPVFRKLIAHVDMDKLGPVDGATRANEEWSSRKWWSEQISDEMRDTAARREAEKAGASSS